MRRVVVANLIISSIILVLLSVGICVVLINPVGAEPVVYECTCSVEETDVVVETEPVKTVETTESTETAEPTYFGEFMLTAYCPCSDCCGEWSNGITATGTTATQGRTIAVDPKVIPYGTEVIINGKIYVAEDCGGAINGNRIDIYFDSHSEALNFGVQYTNVYVRS